MTAMLTTRVQARAAVLRVCDVDIRRFCAGIQPGDGNLMECFYKARQNMSPSCQTAVTNAGYDAPINASAATTQVALELDRSHQQPPGRRAGRAGAQRRALAANGGSKPERSLPDQSDEPRTLGRATGKARAADHRNPVRLQLGADTPEFVCEPSVSWRTPSIIRICKAIAS